MKVLVCGGRDFEDYELLHDSLDYHFEEGAIISHIIHGAAKGADSLAGRYAREHNIQEVLCPANWTIGKSAGFIRNHMMLNLLSKEDCDYVVAFPGGKGTAHTTTMAKARGVNCIEIKKE